MKILLANYRYFVSGGPERYMFNVAEGLEKRGHEIIPFSVRYKRNRPTPYARYFVDPLGDSDEVYLREHLGRLNSLPRTLSRLFYARDVERAVSRLVADTQPQVAYVLHYLRKLSPSLLVGLKKMGVPIVVRLSDFGVVCPQAHCLRNETPCDLCVAGNLLPSVANRCVQGSLATSALNAIATWYHRFRHYFDLIDVFVTTNSFMMDMMRRVGIAEQRLRLIPTFTDLRTFSPSDGFRKDDYIAYVGRLERIKGVHVLVEAFRLLQRRRPRSNLRLKIAGVGNDRTYVGDLQRMAEHNGLSSIVEFLGDLSALDIAELLRGARLSVIPSLWYENLPNALLESYACGTPVLASDLGSLREAVMPGETGHLHRVGDVHHLADKMELMLDHPAEAADMARRCRRAAETTYSPQRHLAQLEELFTSLT